MRVGILSLLATTLGALLALAAPVSAAPRTGVLTGQVVRDATTVQCVREPCVQPASGVVLTILRNGLLVARPRTDVEGRFRLALLPGRYAIRNPRLGPDRLVQVVVGGTVKLDLRLLGSGAKAVPEG